MLGSLLKIFGRGFLHWFTQRTSACSLVVSVVVLSVSNDLFFGLGVFLLILVHFEVGVHTLVSDYMHDSRSKLFMNVSVDLLMISLAKTVFVLLICV